MSNRMVLALVCNVCVLMAFSARAQDQLPPDTSATDTSAAAVDLAAPAPADDGPAPAPADQPGTAPETEQATSTPTETIPAQTQEQTPAAASPPENPGAVHLDDVMVTATKRSQSARTIPASITALHGEDLEKIGARDMKDFLNQVPGINLTGDSDKPAKISIRGVGPSDGANETTGILLGDIALTDPYGTLPIADPDPFDMRDVEILKGPQGTLFGASALNGAIRYVPNDPKLGEWQSKLFADWTTVNEGSSAPTYGAMLNLPIGDSIALRGSGVLQYLPGLIDFTYKNKPDVKDADTGRKWTGRAMGRWDATDRLSVNLLHMRQQRNSDELGFVTNDSGDLERDDAPTPSTRKVDFTVSSLDLRYAFDWATLVSQTARQAKKVNILLDGSYTLGGTLAAQGLHTAGAFETVDAEGYTQELRLVSQDGGAWTWLVGGLYSSYTADILNDNFVPLDAVGSIPGLAGILSSLPVLPSGLITNRGISLVSLQLSPLKASERALFGEVTRNLGERLKITLGGRAYQSHVGGVSDSKGIVSIAAARSFDDSKNLVVDAKGFSPKFSLSYQVTEDIFSYANISRGFQFGGVNITPGLGFDPTSPPPGTHPTFRSSTIWSYEGGVRTDWLDRTLRVDLTLFHLDWKDPQIYVIAANDSYIDNIGGSSSNGAEATLRYLTPVEGLSLTTAASYIIAKTSKPYTASSGNVVPSGTDMPLSPRLQATTTLNYTAFIGSWVAGSQLLYSYQGEAYNNINHGATIFDFGTINLNLNIARPDLSYRPALTLSAVNLADNRAVIGGGANGDPNTTTGAESSAGLTRVATTYNRPRAISLRLSAEF